MSDTESGRKVGRIRCLSFLSQSKSECNRTTKRACHQKYHTPKVIRIVNRRFWEALQFHTYCFANTSGCCGAQVARNVTRLRNHLQIQIQTNSLDRYNPLSTIFSISSFMTICNTNQIHEGADLWLLHFFMRKQAVAALSERLQHRAKSSGRRQNYGSLTVSCEVVNYLLETYSTDDLIAQNRCWDHEVTQLQKTIRWRTANYSWWVPFFAKKCTDCTCSWEILSKGKKAPPARTVSRPVHQTIMQQTKTWCDMQHP